MPYFIKTERFTDDTLELLPEKRYMYIAAHRKWVLGLRNSGINISSGYLVDQKGEAGGGGLLVLEAESLKEAKSILEKDPMIANNLVNWKLQEWISVSGKLIN